MQRAGLVNKSSAKAKDPRRDQVKSAALSRWQSVAGPLPKQASAPAGQPQQAAITAGEAARDFSHIPVHPPEGGRGHVRVPARPQLMRPRARTEVPLYVGDIHDPLETAAERAVRTHVANPGAAASSPRSGQQAPAIVQQALASPGRPLDAGSRAHFEARFQQDFSSVRVHGGGVAARAAKAIDARAFTVADHIVLGDQGTDGNLLAHELAHVVQQSVAMMPWVQRQPLAGGKAKPRQDFVFIMGKDKKGTNNPFYTIASKYFHAHYPSATFVEDKRSLSDMLDWISSNVSDPIGNIYIVSHGNEDGTLAFGLDSSSKDGHMSVIDLRNALHPQGGGTSSLTSVASVIDAHTRIHIKGCDIGRTKEMVELIDEAFGGAGTVTAPTHEQDYTTDPRLGEQARKVAHDKEIAAFKAGLPALPPQPAAVDPKLKGAARKKAKKDHDDAVAARKKAQAEQAKAVAAEEKRIKPELDAIERKAGTVDYLSGPMFQRPGTRWFTAAELKPEIDRLYGQLSEAQRKSLAKRLVAPDHGGPHDQQGQKTITIKPFSETVSEPASLAEAKVLLAKQFKADHFVPTSMTEKRTHGSNGTDLELTFTGKAHPPGADPFDTTATSTMTIPDDATIIAEGRAETNNPDRYHWRVERTHTNSGKTKLTAVGERVMAYLHHGLLNPKPHEYFSEPESNPDFYATSTFAPPSPPSGSGKTHP